MKAFLSLLRSLMFPRFGITPPHEHAYDPLVIPANIGARVKRTVVEANLAGVYQILPSDQYVVAVDTCSLLLPVASAVPEGWVVQCCNPDPTNLSVFVVPYGSNTIEGIANSVSLATGPSALFVSDGVDNWESTHLPSVPET